MENYKKEFIEFMVESDVLKFGEFTLKSGRMPKRSMTIMEMILTYCLDRRIREFRFPLQLRLLFINYMEKRSAIAPIVKKSKIMAIRVFYLEAR